MTQSQLKFHLCISVQEWGHKNLVGHAQDVIVTEVLPKKKKSQWMVILLSNDKRFCPWSLMMKGCPFLSLFLSATRVFFRGFWCFSSKQAVRCSVCLGCAIHCILASHKTHEFWGKQLSQLCGRTIEANFKNTDRLKKKKLDPNAQLGRLSFLSCFYIYL